MSEHMDPRSLITARSRTGFANYVSTNRMGRWEYTGWMDESMSWKQTCYIGDWSWLKEFVVKGPDALKFFSDHAVNSMAKFDVGQAKHAIFCNNEGKVIGEGVLMRLGEEELSFQALGPVFSWLRYKLEKGGYHASAWLGLSSFKLQVSGPNALFVLEKVTGESLRDIGYMRFRKAHINGREVYPLRQGMAGEIGFELHGPNEYTREVRDAILEAGREFGIRQLGQRVATVNHLEASFPTEAVDYVPAVFGEGMGDFGESVDLTAVEVRFKVAGSFEADDISAWFRSPVELGWGKNIKFDHAFVGQEALEAEVAHPKRKLVTLVWNADDITDVFASLFRQGEPYQFMDMPRQGWVCMHADQVLNGVKLVGTTTSRGYSYYFRQMLSLCPIDIELSKPGTEVIVVWGDPGKPQKKIRATVAPAPYKKDNRRTDLTTLPSYLNR